MPLVAIVMGSKSDAEDMRPAMDVLTKLGIEHEVAVLSAHRTPERVRQFATGARGRWIEVIIAAAGGAAHLPGVNASWTTLPVIGVPLPSGYLQGVDALLSTVQMPPGVPVAAVGIGQAGAKNAALLAAQIIGRHDPEVDAAIARHKERLAEQVDQKNQALRERLAGGRSRK